jgi:hypothetical protein
MGTILAFLHGYERTINEMVRAFSINGRNIGRIANSPDDRRRKRFRNPAFAPAVDDRAPEAAAWTDRNSTGKIDSGAASPAINEYETTCKGNDCPAGADLQAGDDHRLACGRMPGRD